MILENLSEKAVLDHFLLTGRSSVPRLADWCGVPATTSLGIVRRLVAKGLVVRGPETLGTRGRPVVTYRPRLPKPLVVCQFDGTQLTGALVECGLEVRGRQVRPIRGIQQKQQALETVRQLCEAVLAETAIARESLAGLALLVSAVDVGGSCLVSSVLPWVDDRLEETLSAGLQTEVRIVRTPVRVIAEYQQRVDRDQTPPGSVVAFNVADGLSAEAVVQGRPLRGECSLAGELGHVIVEREGPLCGCGRRGCLEAFCSGPAICRQVAEGLAAAGVASRLDAQLFREASPREAIEGLWQAWQEGDSYAHAVMDAVLDRLGWGLGLVLTLFDPQVVAVHGYVLDNKPAWLEETRRRASRWTLHAARRTNRVEFGLAAWDDIARVAACDYCYPLGGLTALAPAP
jgi:glucokinase